MRTERSLPIGPPGGVVSPDKEDESMDGAEPWRRPRAVVVFATAKSFCTKPRGRGIEKCNLSANEKVMCGGVLVLPNADPHEILMCGLRRNKYLHRLNEIR